MVQKCVVYKKIRKCRRNLFSPKLKVLTDDITIILSLLSFGLALLYHTGGEISRSWYVKTRVKKIAIKISLLYLSAHCRDFIGEIKKACYTDFKIPYNPH